MSEPEHDPAPPADDPAPDGPVPAVDYSPANAAPSADRAPGSRFTLPVALLLHGALLYWLLTRVFAMPLVSYDGFWHLQTGMLIVESGSVPRIDPLCFTTVGFDWINLNWLTQDLLYRLYRWLGFTGPLWLASFLYVVCLAVSLLNLRARRVRALPTLIALTFVAVGVQTAYGIRPRGFTFAGLAVVAWLLAIPDPERRCGWKRALGLLGVLAVWNHLHGGFVYGYGLVGFRLVGEAIDTWRHERRVITRRALILTGVLGLALASFVVHPHGLDALHHALTYPARFDPAYFEVVNELRPLDFRSKPGRFVEVFLLLLVAALFYSRRRVSWADLLPTLIFVHLTLTVVRGITPLFLIAGPYLAELLSPRDDRPPLLAPVENALQSWLKTTPLILAVVLLVVSVEVHGPRLQAGQPADIEDELIKPSYFPVEATLKLREDPSRGRVFNTFRFGGLLGWALYPQEQRIFFDGRGDLHSHGDSLTVYRTILELKPGWRDELAKLDVEWALIDGETPLSHALEREPGWELVFSESDEGAGAVLLRRAP